MTHKPDSRFYKKPNPVTYAELAAQNNRRIYDAVIKLTIAQKLAAPEPATATNADGTNS